MDKMAIQAEILSIEGELNNGYEAFKGDHFEDFAGEAEDFDEWFEENFGSFDEWAASQPVYQEYETLKTLIGC